MRFDCQYRTIDLLKNGLGGVAHDETADARARDGTHDDAINLQAFGQRCHQVPIHAGKQAVAQLDHPNILAIYDIGTHEGAAYMVMELLPGETLAALNPEVTLAPLAERLTPDNAITVVLSILVGGVTLTTFGDHHSLPRFGLPDLFWLNSTSFQGLEGFAEEKRAAALLLAAYEQDVNGDIARVMMELGREALNERALAARTTVEEGKVDRILAFLEAAEYVERKDGAWQAKVLVLRPEDAEPVATMVALGREIMADWHEANYASIRQALSDLTPIRNGVPFEQVYTEIWHFVFGFANRMLVEEGLFADPYAESRRYQGFLPVVWDARLAESP